MDHQKSPSSRLLEVAFLLDCYIYAEKLYNSKPGNLGCTQKKESTRLTHQKRTWYKMTPLHQSKDSRKNEETGRHGASASRQPTAPPFLLTGVQPEIPMGTTVNLVSE
jgi:hypothetical protein